MRITIISGLICISASIYATEVPNVLGDYKPPPNRTPEMQAFDKALLFLQSKQEDDGHWSAAKSGAQAEFANINGDITLTALCAATMLDACSNKQQNPKALAAAKRAIQWLTNQIREDGGIADEKATGEPVTAQVFAALTLLQAADLSSRPAMHENAAKLCRHLTNSMGAKPGGFGATPGDEAARADLTALVTVMFNQARGSDVTFAPAEVKGAKGAEQAQTKKIEADIRKGLAQLFCEPKAAGLMALSSDKREPDWDGTIGGMLIHAAFLIQEPQVQKGMTYIIGAEYDMEKQEETKAFPGFTSHLKWGEKGEAYRALTLLEGSMLIFNVYGPGQLVYSTWITQVLSLITDHQSADGGWDAAGPDARLGRFWRTGLQSRILILLAPPQVSPPPPPAAPPENPAK